MHSPPLTPDILRTKRDGRALTDAEIRSFMEGYSTGRIPDYQASALLMAIFLRGMDARELSTWTDAMLHSGAVLDLSAVPGFKVDKHSTGGVGDKISLPLAPLVAEAGLPVPMISGRGLGHTGGTLDKLESIPGFKTGQSLERFIELLQEHRFGLIGQTEEIAPADKALYALRDVTATVESIPLIASSIMSKKLAEGIDGLVLDVKTGSGAFMVRREDARKLAQTMVGIGKAAGKKVVALLTDMSQPLGRTVGNALEVRESCEVLQGGGPADVRELTVRLGAEMIVMGGLESSVEAASQRLEAILDSGKALERFARLTAAQGGDAQALVDFGRLPQATEQLVVQAPRDGFVARFDTAEIGRAALVLGAGRKRKEDPVDPAVGLEVHARIGQPVAAGEPLFTIHARDGRGVEDATRRLLAATVVGDEAVAEPVLVLDRID